MESFKANFLIVIFVAIVLALAYWAISSLQVNSAALVATTPMDDVAPVIVTEPDDVVTQPETPTTETPTPETPTAETPAPTGEHAELIADLQELIDDNILMKKGSRGTRVGTVQKFLNEYGAKVSVDNDYGDSVVTAVKKFQSDQKLSADGQTGATTYKKMIEWLEAN